MDVGVLNALLGGQLWTIIFIRKQDGIISQRPRVGELQGNNFMLEELCMKYSRQLKTQQFYF
jgi:hypothetical protein